MQGAVGRERTVFRGGGGCSGVATMGVARGTVVDAVGLGAAGLVIGVSVVVVVVIVGTADSSEVSAGNAGG